MMSDKEDKNLPDLKYGSFLQVLTDWVDTTNMVVIGGRGVAKSTVVIARRSLRCVRDMPGAPIAIVANTYSNLVNNIMPAVQNGWKLQGLIEGVHYIKGKKPPRAWAQRCSVIVDDYKYVYSFWNGAVLFLGSLDNPSLLAGKSVAHLFFDEAKFASDVRASRVMPILRGDAVRYGRSVYYGGVTITTDMPDITEGEYDWFFRYASEMDSERIVRIVQTADLRNRQLKKLIKINAETPPDERKLAATEKRIARFDNALLKLRRRQTFFANVSSFANIDILTLDYARRMYEGALDYHEFLKSVMGMRPGVRRSARFYLLFGSQHKYTDSTRSGVAAYDCGELLYLNPDNPLEAGMDFGNMLSMIVAQPDGAKYRLHKNLYVLTPKWHRDLADEFLRFFAPHRCKVLYLFYDRAGNSYQAQGEDSASKIKNAIERDAQGRPTGWRVELMSRKQGTIYQDAEFTFMQEILSEGNPKLPQILVDALNCPELICSIEGAKAQIKFKGERKIVAKVKSSEKLPVQKLPRQSTNFSDAFKYLLMRRQWVDAAKSSGGTFSGGVAASLSAMVVRFMAGRNEK